MVAVSSVISGWERICSVTKSENASRSTASAPPAGTEVFRAQGINSDPMRSISAFNNPAADARRSAFNELEQTSSARPFR